LLRRSIKYGIAAALGFVLLTGCAFSPVNFTSEAARMAQAVADGLIISPEELTQVSGIEYNVAMVFRGRLTHTFEVPVQEAYPVETKLNNPRAGTVAERVAGVGVNVQRGELLFRLTFDTVMLAEQEQNQLQRIADLEDAHAAALSQRLSNIESFKNNIPENMTEGQLEIHLMRLNSMEEDLGLFIFQHERQLALEMERLADIKTAQRGDILYSPFNGIVQEVRSGSSVGMTIPPNQQLITISSTEYWMLEVSGASIDTVRYGDILTLVDEEGEEFLCVVASDPLAHTTRGMNFNFFIKPLDPLVPLEAFSSGFVYAILSSFDIHDAVLVPTVAIRDEPQPFGGMRHFVNVWEGDIIRKRYIQAGFSHGGLTQVLFGLEPGQFVVLD
jgi:multidrug efflux pump subunit AcrA (membrane-fusion protein)